MERIFIIQFLEGIFFTNNWLYTVYIFNFCMVIPTFFKLFSRYLFTTRCHRMNTVFCPCL